MVHDSLHIYNHGDVEVKFCGKEGDIYLIIFDQINELVTEANTGGTITMKSISLNMDFNTTTFYNFEEKDPIKYSFVLNFLIDVAPENFTMIFERFTNLKVFS